MKETGVIRRIDDLGRIVIPKEIRKRLRVDHGDPIDIFTNDKEIILRKFEPLNEIEHYLHKFLVSLVRSNKIDILLTNKDEITFSTLEGIKPKDSLTNDFINNAKKYDQYEFTKGLEIEITNSYKNDKYGVIQKMVSNGDYLGLVIIFTDSFVTKKEKDLAMIITNYVIELTKELY